MTAQVRKSCADPVPRALRRFVDWRAPSRTQYTRDARGIERRCEDVPARRLERSDLARPNCLCRQNGHAVNAGNVRHTGISPDGLNSTIADNATLSST